MWPTYGSTMRWFDHVPQLKFSSDLKLEIACWCGHNKNSIKGPGGLIRSKKLNGI